MFIRLDRVPACDGRTDGRTDRQTDRRNCCRYYCALHCMQCGRAVKNGPARSPWDQSSEYLWWSLRWKRLEEKVCFKSRVKQRRSDWWWRQCGSDLCSVVRRWKTRIQIEKCIKLEVERLHFIFKLFHLQLMFATLIQRKEIPFLISCFDSTYSRTVFLLSKQDTRNGISFRCISVANTSCR